MKLTGKKCLVTGGAGFIGSHLVDRLMEKGNQVVVFDNLSSGRKSFLSKHLDHERFTFILGDLLDKKMLEETVKDFDAVFHLAANPDVKRGAEDTLVHLEQNVIATHNLLEACRKGGVGDIYFTSTSTIYGEADEIPTPEDYGPLEPISLYGASKLSCEALISSYSHNFDMRSISFRFANVVGDRSTHGVTYDFVEKLKENPRELEILGTDPGTVKSYVHISDTIDGFIHACEHFQGRVGFFNVGSKDMTNVRQIAETVSQVMGLDDVKFRFTGGVDGGRGWKGDVKVMRLSIENLEKLGWRPKISSTDAIRKTAECLVG